MQGVWKVFGANSARFQQLAPGERTAEALQRRQWIGAVQDATFDIARGEVFVLMGLSGSGKSTLLRCLTCLIEPTAGSVLLNGEDLTRADETRLIALRRKHMGMVFQHFALLPNRTVLQNVAWPLEVQGTKPAQAAAVAQRLIEMVGLQGRESRYPSELSGGQQQRVGIARSLATDPDFWFLDEPFSALDPLIRTDLQDEVIRLQKQLAKTVVFVTHDLDEAIKIADRIAIMEHGRIVQIGTPETLVTRPATDYVRRFVAKVSPARVVSVRSLMVSAPSGTIEGAPVPVDAKLCDLGAHLVSGPPFLPVMDASGTMVGAIDRVNALRVVVSGFNAS